MKEGRLDLDFPAFCMVACLCWFSTISMHMMNYLCNKDTPRCKRSKSASVFMMEQPVWQDWWQNRDIFLNVFQLIEKLQFLLLDTPPSEITEKETAQYQETILELENLLHQKYNEATEQLLKVSFTASKLQHVQCMEILLQVFCCDGCSQCVVLFCFLYCDKNHVWNSYQTSNLLRILAFLWKLLFKLRHLIFHYCDLRRCWKQVAPSEICFLLSP